jgi:predicted secreted acid phosphatase
MSRGNAVNLDAVSRAHRMLSVFADNYSHIYKPAIVFDIDGTLVDEEAGLPILPVIKVYNQSLELGFSNFIVTARTNYDKTNELTKKQLKECGILNYSGLVFRPDAFVDVSTFKKGARKQIHDSGFTILMSVGDNVCDIGDYGGLGVLLKPK